MIQKLKKEFEDKFAYKNIWGARVVYESPDTLWKWIEKALKDERKMIKRDLLESADRHESEELRIEVEQYFR